MASFSLRGHDSDFITLEITNVKDYSKYPSRNGGSCVDISLEIKSGDFRASGMIDLDSTAISRSHEQLQGCYKSLNLTDGCETFLEVEVKFLDRGRVVISGQYQERMDRSNKLVFEIES